MTHTPTPRSDDDAGWAEETGRFAIDPETGIAFGTFTGALRPADLLTAMATTVRYRGNRSGLSALADLRDATVQWNGGEELSFRQALYGQFSTRIMGRCALLAPRGAGGAHAGTETLLENLYLRVDARLFGDFGQAMRWLLQPDAARHGECGRQKPAGIEPALHTALHAAPQAARCG